MQTLHNIKAARKCCLWALHVEMQQLGAVGAGGSRGEPQGLQQPGCQVGRPGWLSPREGTGDGCQGRWLDRNQAGQSGRGVCLHGLESSCTHGCSWGESSLGSCSAWGSIPTQLLPSHVPLLGLALSSPGSWGILGHPREPGWQGTISDGMQGSGPGACWGKELRRRLASPGGWHPRLEEAPLPGQRCPRGQEEARLHHRHLPHQTPIPEEALSAANASQQPPQSLRAWQDAPRLHLLQMDRIGGEQSTGEFSQRSHDRSPRERQTVPSGSTSLGAQQRACWAPKPAGQWAGAHGLSPPGPGSAIPWWWPGRSHSTGAGQKTTAPFSPKKCPAAKPGLAPAANEEIRLVGFYFFLLQSSLESWCGPGSGANADLCITPWGWGVLHGCLPSSLPIPGAGSSRQQPPGQSRLFSSDTLQDLEKKREIFSPPSILA